MPRPSCPILFSPNANTEPVSGRKGHHRKESNAAGSDRDLGPKAPNKNSSFARRTASKMVFIPQGGGPDGSEQSRFTAGTPRALPGPRCLGLGLRETSRPPHLWVRLSTPSGSTHPGYSTPPPEDRPASCHKAETSPSLPVKARVWFRPQAADTITSWLRPSMSLGASTLLVSPCPSCPFSFRPADQEQDEVGRTEGGQSSFPGQVGTLKLGQMWSPRRCPPV